MITELRFLPENQGIAVVLNGARRFEIGWKPALEACKALDAQIRNAEARALDPTVVPLPETGIRIGGTELTFRQEIGQVICILGGQLLFEMSTSASNVGDSPARLVWQRWLTAAKVLEEIASADQVAMDAAILHRSGAPIGLTNHPKIRAEAAKIADGDRDIRRFMQDKRKGPVLAAPVVRLAPPSSPVERAIELARRLPASKVAELRSSLIH